MYIIYTYNIHWYGNNFEINLPTIVFFQCFRYERN